MLSRAVDSVYFQGLNCRTTFEPQNSLVEIVWSSPSHQTQRYSDKKKMVATYISLCNATEHRLLEKRKKRDWVILKHRVQTGRPSEEEFSHWGRYLKGW